MMIKRLTHVDGHMDFIREINQDPDFREPMLRTEEQVRHNLLEAVSKPTNRVFGVFDGEEMTGLFVFLVLERESYLEMIVGLSRALKAYQEMLSYLKETYPGWGADFVYNPGNRFLHRLLQAERAEFEPEQQKMVLKRDVPYQSRRRIELYSPHYREQYCALHANDNNRYWTAEKVINAPDRFRTILAIENGEVVGYIDVTHPYEENEPYDVFVREDRRRQGWGKAMLAKAIELNRPKAMMLLVDIDNTAAIALYESMGFVKTEGENNITAHMRL